MLLNQKIFYLSSEAPTVYFVASRLLAVTGGNFSGSAAASMQPVSTNYSVTVLKPDATTSTFTVTPAANGLASFTLPLIGYQQGVWSWSAVNAVTSTASDYVWGLFYWGDATYAALNTNASTAATQATTAATQATTAATQATTAATQATNAAADALTAKTSVTAGGYVATRVDTTQTAVTLGGTLYTNASTAATQATSAATNASTAATAATNASTAASAAQTAATTAATQATTAATQATAANTSVQAGGYVGTRVNTASTALTTNITTPVPSLTGTPPNVASQVALLYWVLAGLERTFDPVTGRVYLDTTPIAGSLPPGTQVYFQCWADVARTIPATTLAEVLVQDPIAYV